MQTYMSKCVKYNMNKNNSTYVFHQNVSLSYQEKYFGAQEAPFVPASVRIVVLIY